MVLLIVKGLIVLLWSLLRFFLLRRRFSCLLRFAKIEISRATRSKVEYKRFNKIRFEHLWYTASHILNLLVSIIDNSVVPSAVLLVLVLIFPMLLNIT